MVGKGNLAIFESSNISETEKVTHTKIGVHGFHVDLYIHECFEPILLFDSALLLLRQKAP